MDREHERGPAAPAGQPGRTSATAETDELGQASAVGQSAELAAAPEAEHLTIIGAPKTPETAASWALAVPAIDELAGRLDAGAIDQEEAEDLAAELAAEHPLKAISANVSDDGAWTLSADMNPSATGRGKVKQRTFGKTPKRTGKGTNKSGVGVAKPKRPKAPKLVKTAPMRRGNELRARGNPANAQAVRDLADMQQIALDCLPAMYVDEVFDANGDPAPAPAHAYTSPQSGDAEEALRQERNVAGGRVRTSAPLVYSSSYFNYKIELINTAVSVAPQQTGVDPTQGFRVVARTLKGSGRDQGRANRFGEAWSFNPAYAWPGAQVPTAAQFATDFGLDVNLHTVGAPVNHTQLPTDASQPLIFYLDNTTVDPNSTYSGALNTQRSYRTAQAFDAEYQRLGGVDFLATRMMSTPPQVGRQLAGRSPGAAMGSSAHQHVTAGEGGVAGIQLASHEWCHLVGDGDGGASDANNLVIGTHAVNTEQLAMELALRRFRKALEVLGCGISLTVCAETRTPDLVSNNNARHANWISYDIRIVNSTDPGDANAIGVHRQIMDGNRGAIPRTEFALLNNALSKRIKTILTYLQQKRDEGLLGADKIFDPQVFPACPPP